MTGDRVTDDIVTGDMVTGGPAGGLRVAVDRDACCGSGNCVMTVPQVFDQDDEFGLVVLLDPEPPAEHAAAVRKAAHLCPAGAIDLLES